MDEMVGIKIIMADATFSKKDKKRIPVKKVPMRII